MMRALSLFAGIGGFDLGLRRAGIEVAAMCEINSFCQAVLRKNFPGVPIYDDIRTLDFTEKVVDLICGGFPCQPFSTASRGRRIAPDLWPAMLEQVRAVKPRSVLCENVSEAAITQAERDLAYLGYTTDKRRISADDCGADHQRDRWWLCAYANPQGEFRRVIDAEMARLPTLCVGVWGAENYARAVRISNGASARLDRAAVEALGNAVLPQIPEAYGNALLAIARAA